MAPKVPPNQVPGGDLADSVGKHEESDFQDDGETFEEESDDAAETSDFD